MNIKNKLIILIISVFVIVLFDAFFSISSILLNIEGFFNFNKFEDSLFDKLVTNLFLLTISITAIKISLREYDLNQIFKFNKKIFFYVPAAIVAGILTNIFGVFIIDLLTSSLYDFGHGEKISQTFSYIDTNSKKIIYIFMVGIVIPIIEEIYMRLYAYNLLREKFNIIVAILLNTIIFLLFHINPSLFPFIIIGNIILCLSYEYTKNLLVPMLIHVTINTYSIIV